MLELDARRTACAFDNLVGCMRSLFYQVPKVTHILSSRIPLEAYEAQSEQHDPPVTTFKGVPVYLDSSVPHREMHFWCNTECVGKLTNIF